MANQIDSDSEGAWELQPDDSDNDAGSQVASSTPTAPPPVAPAPPSTSLEPTARKRESTGRTGAARKPKRPRTGKEPQQSQQQENEPQNLDERNPRSSAYILRDELQEMCRKRGIFAHNTEIRASLLHKLKNADAFARAAEQETQYNTALSIFTADFFWRSEGIDSWRIIALMACTCRILRCIDREDQVYEQVSKNMQVALAKKHTAFGNYAMYNAMNRIAKMAREHVFTLNSNQYHEHTIGRMSWYATEFLDTRPSEEQVNYVSRLTENQLAIMKGSRAWEALEYWNKPKQNGEPTWDEPTRIAMLYRLTPRRENPRNRSNVQGVDFDKTKVGYIMDSTPLAIFRQAIGFGNSIAGIKAQFWRNEYNKQFAILKLEKKRKFAVAVDEFRKAKRTRIMQAVLMEVIKPKVDFDSHQFDLMTEECISVSIPLQLSSKTVSSHQVTKCPPTRLVEAYAYAMGIDDIMHKCILEACRKTGNPFWTSIIMKHFIENISEVHDICMRLAVVDGDQFPVYKKLKKTFRFENCKAVVE